MELAEVDNTKEWTVEDYLGLGEESRYQLINGELIMSPSPSLRHQLVLGNLYTIFKEVSTSNSSVAILAPIDIYFDKKNVFQPDLVLVSKERKHILSERGMEGAPDLIVEILSPSNSKYDRYEKREKYSQFGVREYWLVDPSNDSIELFHLEKNPDKPAIYQIEKGKINSIVFPELTLNLEKIFESDI